MSTRTRVGCDLASTAEVRESVATFGQRYLRRIYTDAELVACQGRPERLAARFAAKEACAKVLGISRERFRGSTWRSPTMVGAGR